ncbi:PKD domain-containing protein [Candidatus Acetothermia bacterium]|jgi:PKD repeat protein|nr:PKD domain-containing protein [Candidatus Acetothermia bacterium]MCI2436407.1 PKD domain-containing protein [Candidatus Acetothermia bacterium]
MRVVRHVLGLLILLAGMTLPAANGQQGNSVFIIARQGTFAAPVTPLMETGRSAADFYRFTNDQPNTGLEIARQALVFLYRDPNTGDLSLVIILSAPQNQAGGEATLSFSGLPPTAQIALRDDPADTYNFTPPTAQMTWRWLPERADGVIISGLGNEFEIVITPTFTRGIEGWQVLSGSPTNPERFVLPSINEPLVLNASRNSPPTPEFSFSPTTVSVNVAVTFDARASVDPDGKVVKYEWDFDGDGVFEISTEKPTAQYTFTKTGEYKVALRVTDDKGAIATLTRTITVGAEIAFARRDVSTTHAAPGTTFRVTVTVTARAAMSGLGLDEDLPANWQIIPIDSGGATFKAAQIQWVFPTIVRAGETRRIVYDVTIPQTGQLVGGPLPQDFEIVGRVSSTVPDIKEIPVLGETNETFSRVSVVTCLPAVVAIAHLDTTTDTVDLRLSEEVTYEQMRRAVAFWQEETPVPGTCDAPLYVEALKQVVAHHLGKVPVDRSFEEDTTIGGTALRSILTPLPFAQIYLRAPGGNVFRVRVEIQAEKELLGLALSEKLPERWEVKPIESSGAAFKPSDGAWIFTEKIPAGTKRNILYEVIVPTDELINNYMLIGLIEAFLPRFERDVGQDQLVNVVECLEIPVAIARLNVDQDTIDMSLSNKISFAQVQTAIALWLEDEEVVGSCGKMIDFRMLQRLISHWLTDTPVDRPLPPAAR